MASSSPPGVSMESSSPPPGFTFSSTPPHPISSSSPSWSDGSTTTVELELSESGSCAADQVFTRRLRELLGDVEKHRQEEDHKAPCGDAHARDFINTFQATFDLQALSCSTSASDTETDTDIETNSFSCTSSISFDSAAELNTSPFFDLSPIVFASSSPQSSPLPRIHSLTNRKAKPGFSSRIIHRASSYLDALPKEEEHDSEPPRKRPRILTRTSTHTDLRTNLAKTPASLRRAASLRSVPDDDKENVIPTAPASPSSPPTILVPPNARYPGVVRSSKNTKDKCTDECMAVPAIAPPFPLPPMSTESPARLRIRRFVERERQLRVQDGLSTKEGGEKEDKWVWECVGEDLREEVVRWFMEVIPPERATEGSEDGNDICTAVNSPASTSSSVSISCASSRSSTTSSTTTSTTTCTTTVSPTYDRSSPSPSSITSPSSISSSSPTITTTPDSQSRSGSRILTLNEAHTHTPSPCRTNLVDQLSSSPETRFHAAYLFMRFFWLVGMSAEGSGSGSGSGVCPGDGGQAEEGWAFGSELDEEGRRLVTWDVGVACLGISIKYHRDFLYPLLPVYAHEFMKMAPHGPVEYDDLETAHRDVLGALQFRLGDTPQGVLSEVWEAVPALRRVLGVECEYESESESGVGRACACGRGRGCSAKVDGEWRSWGLRDGWNMVQRETWRALCVAVLEPDILRFPLSLLSASAILNGLCVMLVRRYEDMEPWYVYELCAVPGPPVGSSKWRREREERAERTVRDVKKELVELMDMDEETLEGCRTWLRGVVA